jgi:drug/metabolite transporter (DMT)-like permease
MERERMTYGLLSALSWGISTILAALAARRIGALRTVVLGEAAGLAGYLTLFLFGHFSFRGVGSTAWWLVLAGVIAVAGYLALYRGLESGHVGLVSAISACYGGVIAVLSVVLLGEHLTLAATAGVVATVAGVMLAVLRRSAIPDPGAAGAVPPAGAPVIGVAFGLAAALCYGVGGFMIGRYTRDLGWLVPVVIARGGAMVLLLGLLATPLRGPTGGRIAPGLTCALAAGLADAAGLIFFARGDQVGLVAVTAAASSAYPIIPLVGGLLIFRERLLRQQVGGTVLILMGLILLGFSQ